MHMIKNRSGIAASQLGLAAGPEQDAGCVRRAFESGINFFFFYGPGYEPFVQQVSTLVRRKREAVIVATGSGARKDRSLLAVRRKILTALDTEVIDVFFAEYINPQDDPELIFGDDGV